jgi:hypothetical protein
MPNPPGESIRPDPNLVRLSNNFEVRYWMQVFAATREQLEAAVLQVGNHAGAVRGHLDRAAEERSGVLSSDVSGSPRP